jgi:hypothetical protein
MPHAGAAGGEGMIGPIAREMLGIVACLGEAIEQFDHEREPPARLALLRREYMVAAGDLYAELHRPEHAGRIEAGPLVVLADDEGLIHIAMKGPWSAAVRRGFAWNN